MEERPIFMVRVWQDDTDGGWVAEAIQYPGCVSDGDTEEEALDNLVEALVGVLSVRLHAAVVQNEASDSERVLAITT